MFGLNKTLFIMIFTLTLVMSCGNYKEFKEDTGGPFKGTFTLSELSFSNIQKKILTVNKCTTCHKWGSNYEIVKDKIDLIIDRVSTNDIKLKMPPPARFPTFPLTRRQTALLLEWRKRGMPEGSSAPPSPPPTDDILLPNWQSLSKGFLEKKCLDCHNPAGEADHLDFTSRESIWEQKDKEYGAQKLIDLNDPANSYFITKTQDPFDPMPPFTSPAASVTKEEIEVLKEWIRLGMPN